MSHGDNYAGAVASATNSILGARPISLSDSVGKIFDKYSEREDKAYDRALQLQLRQDELEERRLQHADSMALQNKQVDANIEHNKLTREQHVLDKAQEQANADRNYQLSKLTSDQQKLIHDRETEKYNDLQKREALMYAGAPTLSDTDVDTKKPLTEQTRGVFQHGLDDAVANEVANKLAISSYGTDAYDQLNKNILAKASADDRFKNLSLDQIADEAVSKEYAGNYSLPESKAGLSKDDRVALYNLVNAEKHSGSVGNTHLFGNDQTEATNLVRGYAHDIAGNLASDDGMVAGIAKNTVAAVLSKNGIKPTTENVTALTTDLLQGRLSNAEQITAHKNQMEESTKNINALSAAVNALNGKNKDGVSVSKSNTDGSVIDNEGVRTGKITNDKNDNTVMDALSTGNKNFAASAEKNSPFFINDDVPTNLAQKGNYVIENIKKAIKDKNIDVKYAGLMRQAFEDEMHSEYGATPSINPINVDLFSIGSGIIADRVLDRYEVLENAYEKQQKTATTSKFATPLEKAIERHQLLVDNGAPSTDKLINRALSGYKYLYK